MSEYKPGTYVKGSAKREAGSAADAVRLVFEGYRPLLHDLDAFAEDSGEVTTSTTAAIVLDEDPVVTTSAAIVAVPKPPKAERKETA